MRTTVTLDADVEAAVRRLMTQRDVSFTRALNDAIRAGLLTDHGITRSYTRVRDLGAPTWDIPHALRLMSDADDEEVARRLQLGGEAPRREPAASALFGQPNWFIVLL